jgi:hypothetical protein
MTKIDITTTMKSSMKLYDQQNQCDSQNYVHMKVIIENVSQKLIFDVLDIKYDTILEMFWLHNRNSNINWINKKLCTTEYTYKILEQSEMCLSEHKLWNYKITLEEKKNISENHYTQWVKINSRKSETILMRISREFIKH